MLQGTLNDFSLPDVFSLLALTKKSGALQVASGGTDGRVFFREGAVCLALSDARRVPLGARLVSAGLLDAKQVREVVEEHAGSPLAITEALISSGQVEERILSIFLREQIVDAVFELMRLEAGNFSFDAAQPGLSRGVALSVVEVVAEANRRLDEWQLINRRIASPQAVLALVPAAMDGRDGVNLGTEQWDLLALIDGRRTVADVVDLTGKGEFATGRILGDLIEAGLVEAVDPASGKQTRLAALIAAREALRGLEQVETPGALHPELSSAAEPSAGSAVRWLEPKSEEVKLNGEPAKLTRLAPRTRAPEVPLEGAAAAPAPAVAGPPAAEAKAGTAPPPASTVTAEEVVSVTIPEAGETPVPSQPAVDPEMQEIRIPVELPKPTAPAGAQAKPATPAAPPSAAPKTSAAAPRPAPAAGASPGVDRAHVARELASLGLDDGPIIPAPERNGGRLTRDEDVNKGLLLRLIDGVKGA